MHTPFRQIADCVQADGKISIAALPTLQALVLLGILDRLLIKRTNDSVYSVDLGHVVRLARKAQVFDNPKPVATQTWSNWAYNESRRRYDKYL